MVYTALSQVRKTPPTEGHDPIRRRARGMTQAPGLYVHNIIVIINVAVCKHACKQIAFNYGKKKKTSGETFEKKTCKKRRFESRWPNSITAQAAILFFVYEYILNAV